MRKRRKRLLNERVAMVKNLNALNNKVKSLEKRLAALENFNGQKIRMERVSLPLKDMNSYSDVDAMNDALEAEKELLRIMDSLHPKKKGNPEQCH